MIWTGPDGGYWSNANNWTELNTSIHRVPTASDELIFGSLGANTDSIDDMTSLTVDAITCGGFSGTITVTTDLNVTNYVVFYGTLNLEAGITLTVGGGIWLYSYATLHIDGVATPNTIPSIVADFLYVTSGSQIEMLGGAVEIVLEIDDITSDNTVTWSIPTTVTVVEVGDISWEGDLDIGVDAILDVSGAFGIGSPGSTFTMEDGSSLAAGAGVLMSGGGTTYLNNDVEIDTSLVTVGVHELYLTTYGSDVNITGGLRNISGDIIFDDLGVTLNIGGDFTQETNGSLYMLFAFEMDMMAFQPDSLAVGGSLYLSGVLTVAAVDSADPMFGGGRDVLIVYGGSASGDFTSKSFPSAPPTTTAYCGYATISGSTKAYILWYY